MTLNLKYVADAQKANPRKQIPIDPERPSRYADQMRSPETLHEQLTDAISRGRLCLAEGCGFTRSELDALCELGAEKLELGMIEQAITVLRGLVALYPFSAKYYFCLALALLHAEQTQAAAATLKLASTLSPDNLNIRITLIETLLKTGLIDQAQQQATKIIDINELPEPLLQRWQVIETCLKHLLQQDNPKVPPPTARPQKATIAKAPVTFKLPNGKTLPLEKSRYEATQPMIPTPDPDKTHPNISLMTFDESITITAVVRRRLPTQPQETSDDEVTHTAVIVRRNISKQSTDKDTAVAYFSNIDKEN